MVSHKDHECDLFCSKDRYVVVRLGEIYLLSLLLWLNFDQLDILFLVL
jgi:hypothetical protein